MFRICKFFTIFNLYMWKTIQYNTIDIVIGHFASKCWQLTQEKKLKTDEEDLDNLKLSIIFKS